MNTTTNLVSENTNGAAKAAGMPGATSAAGSSSNAAADSGMGGSPMLRVADGEVAAERSMGGSPMRGAPDGVSRANGEAWSRANADAGWAQVAVSGTPQTHGRAAHATAAAASAISHAKTL